MASLGVPFSQGLVESVDGFSVVSQDGERLQTAVHMTSQWPDGSVKWCLVKFICKPDQAQNVGYLLVKDSDPDDQGKLLDGLAVEQSDDSLIISGDGIRYCFQLDGNRIFPRVDVGSSSLWPEDAFSTGLLDSDGQSLRIVRSATTLVRQDSISAIIDVQGAIEGSRYNNINLLFRFEVQLGKVLFVKMEIHNSRRAVHKDGIDRKSVV